MNKFILVFALLCACSYNREWLEENTEPLTAQACIEMCAPISVAYFRPGLRHDHHGRVYNGAYSWDIEHACRCGAGTVEQ